MAKRSTQIQKLLRQIGKEDIFPPNRKSRTVEPKKPNSPTFKKGIPAALEGAGAATRLGTLKQGEFCFFPYDYSMDITIDAENAAATLEYWLFSRT